MTDARFPLRSEMNAIAAAPGKTWFWELESAVIDADRCVGCGACVAACPSDSITVGPDGRPTLAKMCTGCSLCWDFCPRGGLRYEALWPGDDNSDSNDNGNGQIRGGPHGGLGAVNASYSARTRVDLPRAQDGGVVTALLVANLEAGAIDGALLARPSPTEKWKGVPFIARTPEEVLECGGSFYNQTMGLAHLDLSPYQLPPSPRLALVGTPCEIQGLAALQARPWWRGSTQVDAVALTIALLCTKSFDYQGLMLRELRDRRGLDLDAVDRVDVIHGKLVVHDASGHELVREPIKNFHGAALKGCDECADFLGRAADISVGSVGSPDRWSSVLIRTPAGARAIEQAASHLELRPLERPEALVKLDRYDRQVALASLRRDFDPNGPLFWSYDEHTAAYQDTDRAPVIRPG